MNILLTTRKKKLFASEKDDAYLVRLEGHCVLSVSSTKSDVELWSSIGPNVRQAIDKKQLELNIGKDYAKPHISLQTRQELVQIGCPTTTITMLT